MKTFFDKSVDRHVERRLKELSMESDAQIALWKLEREAKEAEMRAELEAEKAEMVYDPLIQKLVTPGRMTFDEKYTRLELLNDWFNEFYDTPHGASVFKKTPNGYISDDPLLVTDAVVQRLNLCRIKKEQQSEWKGWTWMPLVVPTSYAKEYHLEDCDRFILGNEILNKPEQALKMLFEYNLLAMYTKDSYRTCRLLPDMKNGSMTSISVPRNVIEAITRKGMYGSEYNDSIQVVHQMNDGTGVTRISPNSIIHMSQSRLEAEGNYPHVYTLAEFFIDKFGDNIESIGWYQPPAQDNSVWSITMDTYMRTKGLRIWIHNR